MFVGAALGLHICGHGSVGTPEFNDLEETFANIVYIFSKENV